MRFGRLHADPPQVGRDWRTEEAPLFEQLDRKAKLLPFCPLPFKNLSASQKRAKQKRGKPASRTRYGANGLRLRGKNRSHARRALPHAWLLYAVFQFQRCRQRPSPSSRNPCGTAGLQTALSSDTGYSATENVYSQPFQCASKFCSSDQILFDSSFHAYKLSVFFAFICIFSRSSH